MAIQVLVLLPMSNKQGFPSLNFPNILLLFEVLNSSTCIVYVYAYINAHIYVYIYIIYMYNNT